MKNPTSLRRVTPRSGFSLIESMMGVTVFLLVMGGFIQTIGSMAQLTTTGTAEAKLHAEAEKAMETILTDLRRSGFVDVGGLNYPHLFENGHAQGAFAAHKHPSPHPPKTKFKSLAGATTGLTGGENISFVTGRAGISSPTGGTGTTSPGYTGGGTTTVGTAPMLNREIIFIQPVDADGDDWPDMDANRDVVWGAQEISYVVVPDANGTNSLERRLNGANGTPLARNVDQVVFDNPTTAGFAIPLDAVRVSLSLSVVDDDGRIHRRNITGVTRLRNGGMAP